MDDSARVWATKDLLWGRVSTFQLPAIESSCEGVRCCWNSGTRRSRNGWILLRLFTLGVENLEEAIPGKDTPKERKVEGEVCGPVVLDVRELCHSHLNHHSNESLHLYQGYISPVSKNRMSSQRHTFETDPSIIVGSLENVLPHVHRHKQLEEL